MFFLGQRRPYGSYLAFTLGVEGLLRSPSPLVGREGPLGPEPPAEPRRLHQG